MLIFRITIKQLKQKNQNQMIGMGAMTKGRNLEQFIQKIQGNCDISDASGAGIFSICGMALRLRDLNKWEKGFNPWEENNSAELVDWIDHKEQLWEKIEGTAFTPLPLFEKEYDPFDTEAINRILSPLNLFYGAGYAHYLKPTFFLAQIKETRFLAGIPIVILEKELLRDLLTIPALNQDGSILIRRDAAGFFLWDQMVYLKKSGQRFLHFALKQCGLPDTRIESRKTYFESILSVQEQTYIHHEIGEMKDTVFDHQIFREIVAEFPHTPIELLARTVKDLLADTAARGTLEHIISTKNAAGLGFYAAFQDGLFLPLFPQLRQSFEIFESDQDWEEIETARQKGFLTARQYARDLIGIFCNAPDKNHMDQMAEKIFQTLVQPLIA
jgi:hypothetical protein